MSASSTNRTPGLVAFVTGATAGFGRAIAERLVRDGHRVIAAGRRAERLHALREELGEAIHPLPLDVTDDAAVAALPDSLPEDWRAIDVLVNNAGLAAGMDPAQVASVADWDKMVSVNVTGLIHVTHAILPGMLARDRGLIVNLGSTAGTYPYTKGTVYCASKAFVTHFSLALKADVTGTGVRVSCVEPGLVGGSEFTAIRLGSAEKARALYEGIDPLTPADIAETVSWLVALPPHVNINRIELMPTCQGPGPLTVKRPA